MPANKSNKTGSSPSGDAPVNPLEFKPYELKPGEPYMNKSQLLHFSNILNLLKAHLMQEANETVVHMKEEMTHHADPLDRAAQEEGFTLELRTRDRERHLIRKIDRALTLIEQKEHAYGYCEDCGAEIGIRRLEARPTTDKCIDCKTFEEMREKQIGG